MDVFRDVFPAQTARDLNTSFESSSTWLSNIAPDNSSVIYITGNSNIMISSNTFPKSLFIDPGT